MHPALKDGLLEWRSLCMYNQPGDLRLRLGEAEGPQAAGPGVGIQEEDPAGVQENRYSWCGLAYFPAYRGNDAGGDGTTSTHHPGLPAAQQPACHQQVLAGDLKGQASGAGQVGRCHPAHGLVARAEVDPMKVAGEQTRGRNIAVCCYRPLISPDREGGKSVSHSKEWRGRRDSNPRPLP